VYRVHECHHPLLACRPRAALLAAACSGEDQPGAETAGATPTVASTVPSASSILAFDLDPDGAWIVADFDGQRVLRIQPSGETIELADVSSPVDVEVDADGNIYVSDWHGNRVVRIDARTGTVERSRATARPSPAATAARRSRRECRNHRHSRATAAVGCT
jgi:streptogramin lyase